MKTFFGAVSAFVFLAGCNGSTGSATSSNVSSTASASNDVILETSQALANSAESILSVYLRDGEESRMNDAANCLAVGKIYGSIESLFSLRTKTFSPRVLELDDVQKLNELVKKLDDKCNIAGMQTEQDLADAAKALHVKLSDVTAKLYK